MAYPTERGWGPPGLTRTVTLNCPGPYPLHAHPRAAGVMQKLVDGVADIRRRYGLSRIEAWGAYVKRYISGTTTWSNHSWGLAVDLNAVTNPYTVKGTTDYPAAAQAEVRALCKRLKFRWGLDYSGKKDAMHFEFMGTPADADALGGTYNLGDRILSKGDSGPDVEDLQRLLGIKVDGDFGPLTDKAVRAFQERVFGPEKVDGDVGPLTLAALRKPPPPASTTPPKPPAPTLLAPEDDVLLIADKRDGKVYLAADPITPLWLSPGELAGVLEYRKSGRPVELSPENLAALGVKP